MDVLLETSIVESATALSIFISSWVEIQQVHRTLLQQIQNTIYL